MKMSLNGLFADVQEYTDLIEEAQIIKQSVNERGYYYPMELGRVTEITQKIKIIVKNNPYLNQK